jgi:hypothetical protein
MLGNKIYTNQYVALLTSCCPTRHWSFMGPRLTVAYVAQTEEFHGQCGGIHQFVTASLSIRF